jgi:subtilisin family serine protease
VVYEIPDDRSVKSVVEALSKDSNVALAEPLSEFHTLSDTKQPGVPYNDPLYDLQTNLPALGIAAAHEHSQGGGVRIALIDTGVDARHPDLRGRIGTHCRRRE